jgi:hypothetical protein
MITNELGGLLNELGKILNIPNLQPDENNICLLKILGKIQVQIEYDKDRDYLLIGTDFGEIIPGRYTEDLMEVALKANNLKPPLYGILGFSKKNNHLIMFERLWLKDQNGEKLAKFIDGFAKKAVVWKEAIEQSQIPVISDLTTSDHGKGMFGLH